MVDVDTAPGIRSIGTDGVPADYKYGGVVSSITRECVSWGHRSESDYYVNGEYWNA